MSPIVFELGPLRIAWYGILIAAALVIGTAIAGRLAARRAMNPDAVIDGVLWLTIAGIVGARIGYVATNLNQYWDDPVRVLTIWEGGLSFHGIFLLALPVLWWFSRVRDLNPWAYLDVLMPGLAMGVIGGRIGNFMNGTDTLGRLTSLPIGFTWPDTAPAYFGIVATVGAPGPMHLTQIYGALIGAVLLILAWRWLSAGRWPGYVFWQFVLWYSALRFVFEETFRLNPLYLNVINQNSPDQLGIGFFTLTHLVSIPLIALAIWMLRRGAEAEAAGEDEAAPAPAPAHGRRQAP